MGRPSLTISMKPKLEPVKLEPVKLELEQSKLEQTKYKLNFDNKSIGVLINIIFIAILTFGALWLYNVYLDRLDTKITTAEEIHQNNLQNILMGYQPLMMNTETVIPSNLTDVPKDFVELF